MKRRPWHLMDAAGLADGNYVVEVAGGKVQGLAAAATGGGGSLTVQDENGLVATGVTQIDFQGAGVTASAGTGEVVVTIPGGTGGGPASDPRTLFRDDCVVAALPSGVTTTGGLSFDSTELYRKFTGDTSYVSNAFALRGAILAVAEMMQVSGLSGGEWRLDVMKGAAMVARISFQTDGNIVAYDSAGIARGNTGTGTTKPLDGQALRFAIAVSNNGQVAVTVSSLAGGSVSTSPNTGTSTWGIYTHRWASGLSGLTAGDLLTAQVVQTKPGATDRVAALFRLVVMNGAAPL